MPNEDTPEEHRAGLSDRPPLSASLLGFEGDEAAGWTRASDRVPVAYRSLRRLDELAELESLQIEVFGVSDRDLLPASTLIVAPETGGAIIAAYVDGGPAPLLAGALFGWGGFVDSVPRIVSDFLAVRRAFRGLGLGANLKKLQAVLAAERGFREVVWTVDPLRAANARLNVTKLGATAHRYERNRYGEGYGVGLYGGMPSDRLHTEWDLASERVYRRLTRSRSPSVGFDGVPVYSPGLAAPQAAVEIPVDIDALLRDDSEATLRWRFAVRSALESAFDAGWEIREFVSHQDRAAYILSRHRRGSAAGWS